MLQLIELLQDAGKIKFRQQFLDAIGMPKQHFRRVRLGEQHFSPEQIAAACREYEVNANWILGLEKKIWSIRRVAPPAEERQGLPLTKKLTTEPKNKAI